MEVSGQVHAPSHSLPRVRTPVPIEQEAGCATERVGCFGADRNLQPLPGIKLQFDLVAGAEIFVPTTMCVETSGLTQLPV